MILCSRYVLKGEKYIYIYKQQKNSKRGIWYLQSKGEIWQYMVFTMQKRNMAFTKERSGGGKAG